MDQPRRNYTSGRLTEEAAGGDPIALFDRWMNAAMADERIDEAVAMTVATATPDGMPSARVVLLRSFDERGFVFFTNYESRKGRELSANPRAALSLYWGPLERQVRIIGSVERVGAAESDAYFASRPFGSQVASAASHQSRPGSHEELVERARQLASQYSGGAVPRPAHWGGYRVRPETIEFWQGGVNRLHDRVLFTRDGAAWRRTRLDP